MLLADSCSLLTSAPCTDTVDGRKLEYCVYIHDGSESVEIMFECTNYSLEPWAD